MPTNHSFTKMFLELIKVGNVSKILPKMMTVQVTVMNKSFSIAMMKSVSLIGYPKMKKNGQKVRDLQECFRVNAIRVIMSHRLSRKFSVLLT